MTVSHNAKTHDLNQIVTDTIIEQLEKGVVPWEQPWKGKDSLLNGLPYNTSTGNKYRGINIVLLWSATLKHEFQTNEWGTFNHWKAKEEYIGNGQKGNLVVKFDMLEKEVDGEIKELPYLKKYYVFNRSQLRSWEPKGNVDYSQPTSSEILFKSGVMDDFIANTKAIIESHEAGACYRPIEDKIMMPYHELFHDTNTCTAFEGYYAALFHELHHWTGAPHRLNRTKGKRFGDYEYAFEELVAEFGSAFACAEFGISTLAKGDHAAYIDNWLKVLKENKGLLISAAGEASRAFTYLNDLQPKA